MAKKNPWEPFLGKYFIHDEAFEMIRIALSLKLLPLHTLNVEQARERYRILDNAIQDDYVFHGQEKEIVIPSPFSPRGIPLMVYKPDSAPDVPIIMVFCRGGGFVISTREGYQSCLRRIASKTGAVVVSVEYRLLPNNSRHAPVDDAVVATRWVMANKVAVGGRNESVVGMFGTCAGGSIAVTVTGEVRGVAFLVLIYPMSDLSLSQSSYKEFERVPGLNKLDVDWFYKGLKNATDSNSSASINNKNSSAANAIDDQDILTDPRLNNIIRSDLELFPPTLMFLADLDPMRDTGLDFAAKLAASGVDVETQVYKGIIHGFFKYPSVFRTNCDRLNDHVARFVAQFQGKPAVKAAL